MQVIGCFFLSALCIANAVEWGLSRSSCSQLIEDQFGFGSSFKPDIEELFNKAFPSKQSCSKWLDYVRKHLGTWGIDQTKWTLMGEFERRQLMDKMIPLLHYRSKSLDAAQGNLSAEEQEMKNMLKSDLFAATLFDISDDLQQSGVSCTERVQQSLQMLQPLRPPLASYLDALNGSVCATFVSKLKSSLLEFTRLSNSDWLALSNDTKRMVVSSMFALLHIHGKKPNIGKLSVSDRVWKEITKNELFLGEVFAAEPVLEYANVTAQSSSVSGNQTVSAASGGGEHNWRIVFWLVTGLTVGIVIFLGLRLLNVIPAFA